MLSLPNSSHSSLTNHSKSRDLSGRSVCVLGSRNKKNRKYIETIFTEEALAFVADLHRRFNQRRLQLLARRRERSFQLAWSGSLDFFPDTAWIRASEWSVAPVPSDLRDRRVEITGPTERKMMINALNSGAQVFMADCEDATSPTWENVVSGQACLYEAVRETLSMRTEDGKEYSLNKNRATLVVRPRGWHLEDANIEVDGEAVSASLLDFGLHFFHNAKELLQRGSGPYFYLPKLEGHLESRLWNDVFLVAQDQLGLSRGTIRATILIETITAAFEMDEILFELREHASGLNAGRWDYFFSMIKKLSDGQEMIYPDRQQLTMKLPFMRAYCQQLVQVCHRRKAQAIGGMAAFIPSRRNPEINEIALAKVRDDKGREARDGFHGTWVAHPDLVPVALEIFTKHGGLTPSTNVISGAELLPKTIEGGHVTIEGVRENIGVSLQYLASWLNGVGAVAIHHLMEDAATAEIARAELWHWRKREVNVVGAGVMTTPLFVAELESVSKQLEPLALPYHQEAKGILSDLVLSDTFVDFLTSFAYQKLIQLEKMNEESA